MKKKEYKFPVTEVMTIATVNMVCTSPGVGGDAGIGKGEGDPGAGLSGGADSRRSFWDDED